MDATLAGFGTYKNLNRTLALGGIGAIVGGSALVAYFDPSAEHFFPVCPLYRLTGFACPGCGLTRGFHALFHGDILTALHFNALIPLWTVILCFGLISLAMIAIRGKGIPLSKISPNWLFVILIGMLIFGVLRNLPYYPFTSLYPGG